MKVSSLNLVDLDINLFMYLKKNIKNFGDFTIQTISVYSTEY